MHLLKVILLVVLIVTIMRFVSWAFLWMLGRCLKRDSASIRLGANLLGLGAFAAFLIVDSIPGEFIDLQALAFGVVVYAIFFALDAKCLPRFLSRKIQP
jgi:hypothetical protein